MPKKKSSYDLKSVVKDKELINFFYLNLNLDKLIDKMQNIKLELINDNSLVPFTAQLREYKAAVDEDKNYWIAKEIPQCEQFASRMYELAYYIDFELKTLSAPTICLKINDVCHRATKLVKNSAQINGYNYMEEPFRFVLANDLINRWLLFDEDRNPNNYLVTHNSLKEPLVVAIDYNHADLEATEMKITGTPEAFGWNRIEKTRFLTLLKPSNFDCYCIKDFKDRLDALMNLPLEQFKTIAQKLFTHTTDKPKEKAEQIISNLKNRREYIYKYFTQWFKDKPKIQSQTNDADYSGLGQHFVDYYKKRV